MSKSRQIILDVETTGLYPNRGDRIIEIGCVEVIDYLPTGGVYHTYVNPQMNEMPAKAYEIHGIGIDFLQDKPLFGDIAADLLDFVQDSKLVIHNAGFDMKFLNHELTLVDLAKLPMEQAIDTLGLSREKLPKLNRHRLDDLCKHFNVDNSDRTLHGALLDSKLLAKVYLELMGGRQVNMAFLDDNNTQKVTQVDTNATSNEQKQAQITDLPTYEISVEEQQAHSKFMEKVKSG